MLREVKNLHGAVLRARDGEIGSVDEILFDDELWTARYLVVDTGGWLNGRKVLISPAALGLLDWDRQALRVNLTRAQVEGSPGVETDEPVSRQWETDYHDYYGWPYYWNGLGMTGAAWYEGIGLNPADPDAARDPGDVHLRSTKEVTGYGIVAQDGPVGHVEGFIVDDETWKIHYLAVDTHAFIPGKKVLLPTDWIAQANWPELTVTLKVTRDQVRSGPDWNPHEPISRAFEEQLARYYDKQSLGMPESAARRKAAFAGR